MSSLICAGCAWPTRKSAAVLVAKVQRAAARPEVEGPFAIDDVYRACAAAFDSAHGGFGGPTKFLETSVLRFLLVYAEARECSAGAADGLGQLGTRCSPRRSAIAVVFRAYSYSPDWSAPASERDALDQAAMLHLLLEADQPRYTESARALLGFVEGTLFDKAEGAFRGRQVMADTWWTRPHALRRPPGGPDTSLSRRCRCLRRRTRCPSGPASRRRTHQPLYRRPRSGAARLRLRGRGQCRPTGSINPWWHWLYGSWASGAGR